MTKEIWKDIKGFEGLYQVSNFGRIKNLDKIVIGKLPNGQLINKIYKEKIKLIKNNKKGYLRVGLTDGNYIRNAYQIHRLVAETFIINPENKKEVNHINGIKTDNHVENLEWVTRYENITHAIKTGLYDNKNKKVKCIETGIIYNSIIDASRLLNINSSCIVRCCNNGLSKIQQKTAGKFHWEYVKEEKVKGN